MPASPNKLSDDERLELQLISAASQHDDIITYQLSAILLSVSLGAVYLALQNPTYRFALVIGSIGVYIYWWLVAARLAWFSRVRYARAREIEAKGNLLHYIAIMNPNKLENSSVGDMLSKSWERKLSIRRLRLMTLIILIVFWGFVLYALRGFPAAPITV